MAPFWSGIAIGLLWVLLPGGATWAQTASRLSASAQPSPAQSMSREVWRASMSRAPAPQKGCFSATYPNTTWHEVPCTAAPAVPYPPARGPQSDTVGNGTDFAAEVSGSISTAIGSFDSVEGVSSETGTEYAAGCSILSANVADTFSLQLNSSFFTTSVCDDAANPSACLGWQQFVFANTFSEGAGEAFMQYWLINYGATCPAEWTGYADEDCYKNSAAVSIPAQVIADLAQLSLTGNADSGGLDTVTLATGSDIYSASGEDSVVNLALGWQEAEFNIFGNGCGSEADFNGGSTLVVRTSVDNGTTNAPFCEDQGFTGETNNLTLVDPCGTVAGASPAIVFTESKSGESTPTPTATPTPVPVKLKIKPASLNFGAVKVGSSKGPRIFTVSNPKGSKKKPGITVLMEGIGGAGGAFSVNNGCDGPLPAGEKCTIGVRFTPTAAQRYEATLMITDNAESGRHSLSLKGKGK